MVTVSIPYTVASIFVTALVGWIVINPIGFIRFTVWWAERVGGISRDEFRRMAEPTFQRGLMAMVLDGARLADLDPHNRRITGSLLIYVRALFFVTWIFVVPLMLLYISTGR